MSEKCWMMLKTPGVGDVVVWADEDELMERGIVMAENVTRLAPQPNGKLVFVKMADKLPMNMMAVPMWMPCPPEFIADIAQLWNRIVVAEKRILPHD